MRNLLELKTDLNVRRERFNQYRTANIFKSTISESVQVDAQADAPETNIKSKLKVLIKEKLQDKLQGKLQEKVGEIKKLNRTMKQGYFNRQRSIRSYKAMI